MICHHFYANSIIAELFKEQCQYSSNNISLEPKGSSIYFFPLFCFLLFFLLIWNITYSLPPILQLKQTQVSHLRTRTHLSVHSHRENDKHTPTHTCKHLSLFAPVCVSHVGSCISSGASDCCHGVKHPCNPSGFNQPPLLACTCDAKHPAIQPAAFHRCCQQIEDTRRGGRETNTRSSCYLVECSSQRFTNPCDSLYFCRGSYTPTCSLSQALQSAAS